MMGVEEEDEIEAPEAAIPLPAVEGNILELVLKYCNYHYTNKETKEEEKNTWDQEFVKVDDDTLFSLILVSRQLPRHQVTAGPHLQDRGRLHQAVQDSSGDSP